MKNTLKQILGMAPANTKTGEQAANFYDDRYSSTEEYRKPFWQSRYYFLWTVVLDRLRQAGAKQLLEIGCGSGQFAELLKRDYPLEYRGLDISSEAIKQARLKGIDGFHFEEADALTSDLLIGDYDSVVCMEVLEHIEKDLELVERIRTGTRCLFTVPNFPYVSHVRHFETEKQVHDRYGQLLNSLSVWGLAGSHKQGVVYFLLDGIRN